MDGTPEALPSSAAAAAVAAASGRAASTVATAADAGDGPGAAERVHTDAKRVDAEFDDAPPASDGSYDDDAAAERPERDKRDNRRTEQLIDGTGDVIGRVPIGRVPNGLNDATATGCSTGASRVAAASAAAASAAAVAAAARRRRRRRARSSTSTSRSAPSKR